MPSRPLRLAVVCLLLGLGGPDAARALPFTGSLSFSHFEFLTPALLFEGPGGPIPGGGVAVSTPDALSGLQDVTGFTGSRQFFGGTAAPGTLFAFQIEGIRDADLAGPPLRGPLAVPGRFGLSFTAFATPLQRIVLGAPLTENGTRGLGLGGSIALGPMIPPYAVALGFSEWTVGQARVSGIVPRSFAGGFAGAVVTLSRTGFDARTASGRGALQLVTPIRVVRDGSVSGAAFAVLDIEFVPEPASALLVAGGLALLAWGRRRAA